MYDVAFMVTSRIDARSLGQARTDRGQAGQRSDRGAH
jgi:hypothetical protein